MSVRTLTLGRERQMDDWQIDTIQHFLERPGMYITKRDKEQVIAFIHGFEIGSKGTCDLTTRLSQWIEQQYRIKKKALGWSYQIQLYAEKKSVDWFDGFKELVEELLIDNQKRKE